MPLMPAQGVGGVKGFDRDSGAKRHACGGRKEGDSFAYLPPVVEREAMSSPERLSAPV
jgi:hypothetical protein